ncbi:MAG: class I SAM-dependent methyltransferase [Bacteroidota bacterium]|nr:class I SAM-dependent methyltransferase [Bacteroidota bacterium]
MKTNSISSFDSRENATLVNIAFSAQSPLFDIIQNNNVMLQWMRSVVQRHVEEYLKPGDTILDINAGTGIDAVHFAEKGYAVHAMDIAEGMVNEIRRKIISKGLDDRITAEQRSFTEAGELSPKKFDHIFSNFGGLNCVNDLHQVAEQLLRVIKPNGLLTLVIMPPICPWEIAHIFRGDTTIGMRRLHNDGIIAHIEGHYFKTYYHTVSSLIKSFGDQCTVLKIRGVASFSPPPYMEKFPQKFPGVYSFLQSCDERFSMFRPFNRWADQFIITMKVRDI